MKRKCGQSLVSACVGVFVIRWLFKLLLSTPLDAHALRSREYCEPLVRKHWDVDAAIERSATLKREESEKMSTSKFTVLLNTFERDDLLRRAIAHYERCEEVEEIVVVWSEPRAAPREGEIGSEEYYSKTTRTRYETHNGTSIQNRFEPVAGLRTRAVFNVDDDVRVPCGALRRGFASWQQNPDDLVGYFPRNYAPVKKRNKKCTWRYVAREHELWWNGRYSIVLTKAAFMDQRYLKLYKEHLPESVRRYVDNGKNCEDIAMQFLTSAITRRAPVYAPASLAYYIRAKLFGMNVRGISSGTDHHVSRGHCITSFQKMFGTPTLPLVERYF